MRAVPAGCDRAEDVLALADQVGEVAVALDGVGLQVHVEEVVALAAGGAVDAQPVLLAADDVAELLGDLEQCAGVY